MYHDFAPKSNISIHAPLTGSDRGHDFLEIVLRNFNPRSPYGERRLLCSSLFAHIYFNPRSPYGERHEGVVISHAEGAFQSTLPLRGATGKAGKEDSGDEFQSTLPLRGATGYDWQAGTTRKISIHAPLTGSDWCLLLSEGGITISIHAPLTGSDGLTIIGGNNGQDFNPRSPYGERPATNAGICSGDKFQSTLPLRGATPEASASSAVSKYFNPRSPYGERPTDRKFRYSRQDFNPRSPYGERPTPWVP